MSTVVEQVLGCIRFGDEDRARLEDFHARVRGDLPEIAERFYRIIAAHPAIAELLADGAQLERMHGTLVAWLESGLTGPYDHAFHAWCARIGRRHLAVGLPQHYIFAAMNVVRGEYDERIWTLYAPEQARLIARSVDKLLDLELALMLQHDQLDIHEELVERERRIQAERVAAIQTLSSGLAHEVRNPLNSAKLQLELVVRRLRREGDDPKLVEPVRLAHHEIERLTRLLNEFLSFARPPELHLGQHDVAAIAADVITAEHDFAERRGAAVVLEAQGPVLAVIDPAKLRQILQNLVRNAIEAVPRGGRVLVCVRTDGEALELSVTDNGPGIPEPIRNRIYEPFFSTKEGGTGLGMSIVHSMVTLHGGRVELDTGARGTRFVVVLPRTAEPTIVS